VSVPALRVQGLALEWVQALEPAKVSARVPVPVSVQAPARVPARARVVEQQPPRLPALHSV
jgi:hypothetical protein